MAEGKEKLENAVEEAKEAREEVKEAAKEVVSDAKADAQAVKETHKKIKKINVKAEDSEPKHVNLWVLLIAAILCLCTIPMGIISMNQAKEAAAATIETAAEEQENAEEASAVQEEASAQEETTVAVKETKKDTMKLKEENGVLTLYTGKEASTKTGLVTVKDVTYLVRDGKVAADETGIVAVGDGRWVKVNEGVVDTAFTGIGTNEFGTWYILNGIVDFTKNGTVTYDGTDYNVTYGEAEAA